MAIASILHPTDLTRASEIAFDHALRIAVATGARLTVLHVDDGPAHTAPEDFPHVRETLARWQVAFAATDAAAADAEGLPLHVEKINVRGHPLEAVLGHLERTAADLVVLATHRHEGLERLLHRSLATPVAQRTRAMTLFLPHGVRGFVSHDEGWIGLRRILVPVDRTPRPQPAIEAAAALARTLGVRRALFTLLHVGSASEAPAVHPPANADWTWEQVSREGNVVEEILRATWSTGADLVVLSTAGRAGILDALRGSTTERLLAEVPCPLLAVPVPE
ncbi:MAG: universal stress protein [Candidatus Binatia bacterium]